MTDGAILLRKRIESQLASGRIMVCYSHLNELSEKNLPDARVFTFDSDFGSKNLPLDGLFIDCNENVRTGRINKWAGDLLKIYVTKTGFTFQEYEVARNISKNTLVIIPEHFIPSFKPADSFVAQVKDKVK